MKLFVGALAVALLAGCATSPVPSDKARPAPSERVSGYQKPVSGGSSLIVTRDTGFLGGGCFATILSKVGRRGEAGHWRESCLPGAVGRMAAWYGIRRFSTLRRQSRENGDFGSTEAGSAEEIQSVPSCWWWVDSRAAEQLLSI